ncbi:MAG TPA: hypothetical protein DCW93_05105 [Saprospirales bacterium]|nr:hypothetical protein [Saprospirales bacterium]
MKIDKKMARLEQLKTEHRELDIRIQKDYNLRLDVGELKMQKLKLKQSILEMEKEIETNGQLL